MKRTLVLLSPILVAVSATVAWNFLLPPQLGTAFPRWSSFIFLFSVAFFTCSFLLLSYCSVIVYNGVRAVLGRGPTVKGLLLLRPSIVGVLVTLLTGLFRSLVFDREATLYFASYGFPFSWYSLPTANCLQNSQLYDPRTQCQAGFQGYFFLYDALIFVGLYLLLSYASTLFYNAVPLFRNKKWPFFLPKVSVREGTGRTGPAQQ